MMEENTAQIDPLPMTTLPQQSVAPKSTILVGSRGIVISDFDGLWRFASAVSRSGLAPKGIQTPEAIFVAVQMGLEVGLTPMAALQNIAVINGRPSLWGDAQLAVVRATSLLEQFEEWFEENGKRTPRNPVNYDDTTCAVCTLTRAGSAMQEASFSVSDAKRAGLWAKEGPWRQYPARMLRFRARSFLLRDNFGDALKGLLTAEEARDLPIDVETVEPAKLFAPAPVPVPCLAPPEPPKEEKPIRRRRAEPEPKVEAQTIPAPKPVEQTPATQTSALPPEPKQEPKQEPKPQPPTDRNTPQSQLAEYLGDFGVTFDEFRGWLSATGTLRDADSLASYEEVPERIIDWLRKNPKDLAKIVTIYKKETPK